MAGAGRVLLRAVGRGSEPCCASSGALPQVKALRPSGHGGTRAGQGTGLASCCTHLSALLPKRPRHPPPTSAAPTSGPMEPGQPVPPDTHPWPSPVTPLPHCAAGPECCNCSHHAKAGWKTRDLTGKAWPKFSFYNSSSFFFFK